MNAGSATECSQCGAAFEAASVVPASRPKVCPKCREQVSKLLEVCACGHAFPDVRALREQLEDRARVGTAHIIIAVVGLGGCTALMIASSAMFTIAWFGGAALLARGIVTRRHAKADLAEIRRARGALPAARVIP